MTTANNDEHGDARTEEAGGSRGAEAGGALIGEGEWCLRLGLTAEDTGRASVPWLWVAMAVLVCSIRLAVSMESLEGGRCSEGRLKMDGLLKAPGPVSLGLIGKQIKMRLA